MATEESLPTDYNPIAEQYQRAKQQPWRTYVECYTLLNLVGDVQDKTVLDLACGEGFYTRRLRQSGTLRTVGIDLAPAMIELAREQEIRQRLGIEYLVGDVRELHIPEVFDVVVSAYLLNYARDREELATMCQGIADRTAPGGRFVSVNQNPERDFITAPSYRAYGFETMAAEPRREGMPVTWTFHLDDGPLSIENYWLDRAIHESALRAAGFREILWHMPRLSPEAQPPSEGSWSVLLEQAPFTFLECVK